MTTQELVEQLEYELERERREKQELKEAEQERRKQLLTNRKRTYDYEMRTASSWPEALQKQIYLMEIEARYEKNENFIHGSFFTDSVTGCELALKLWAKIEETKQERIAELQKQLEAIREEIRLETARQLRLENVSQGCKSIAASLENDEDFYNWLNW